ncbi:MAG TPA: siderophore-interacting protein [Solirubrobacterales bacterium]|nr:siderophore-interacting protein [Solirubrobacterales bacterium]HMY27284.1 siderophore-interacting protein [Solirubrobacterales bacterium]HNC07044.1 siderophore-interacting protein [Solirubrobacterales bacterium]HNF84928.1 siderophore-interacting protein [Solirubrobacterales bacterium]
MSPRTPILAKVKTTEPLTPHMVRIVLQSEGLRGFPVGEFTDHYVKLQLPPPGASYSAPFDPAQIRESLGRDQWHRQRTYTVRDADPEAGEITIDFVTHGSGLAGPWARDAAAGDLIQLVGPGGAYTPDPEADWHLLAGDDAAIPAIVAALRRIPPAVPALVVLEVENEQEQRELAEKQDIATPGDLRITWLHRCGAGHSDEPRILNLIERLDLPEGRGQAFVHGEAGMVREVRRHLVNERGMDLGDLSATGYWKFRRTEEGWREDKPEWKRLAEQDVSS